MLTIARIQQKDNRKNYAPHKRTATVPEKSQIFWNNIEKNLIGVSRKPVADLLQIRLIFQLVMLKIGQLRENRKKNRSHRRQQKSSTSQMNF